MTGRETIDIEALLCRAYREKRVDRLGNVGATALGLVGPRGPGSSFSTGDKVDTSSFSARVAAAIREMQLRLANAPSGLLDLHDAVLTLDDFYIERGAGLDYLVWDADTAESMGHRITPPNAKTGAAASIVQVRRRGGRGTGRDDLVPAGDPRPLTVITTTNLVMLHGRGADRPYVPDVVVSGYLPVYEGRRKEAVGRRPVYETPLHAVVEGRALHEAWHAALGILAALFARSTEFEVTGPSAPARPWEAPPRILAGAPVTDLRDDEEPAKSRRKPGKKRAKTKLCEAEKAA